MSEVLLSPEARDFYAAADRPLARKLARCFAQVRARAAPAQQCLANSPAICVTALKYVRAEKGTSGKGVGRIGSLFSKLGGQRPLKKTPDLALQKTCMPVKESWCCE